MKSNIITIIKKEFARFFGDRRMVLTTLILPGLMIYIVYSFIGDAISNSITTDDKYNYNVYICNMPDSVDTITEGINFDIKEIDETDIDKTKEEVQDEKIDLLVIFPENFDSDVYTYNSTDLSQNAPNVDIYYNSISNESSGAYSIMISLMDEYESMLTNKFNINNTDSEYDLITEEDATGQMFSMMLPMLMMIFMFSGCMAIAPESIAGEKERGTIATLLVTPVKRSEIAIGKILSLGFLALLSGISSFIGVMLSLPKLMGGDIDNMSASVYSIADYALLLAVILTTILIFISLISIISTFAKTVKEATTVIMPLMIIVMLIGVTSMFGNGPHDYFGWYLIPIYNSAQCMNGIFSFSYSISNIVISLITNIVSVVILMFILTRMFNSEKIMFSK